jgi:hypothetical protein
VPQEDQFIQKLLRDVWGISPSLAEAVCGVAMEATNRGLDLFRLIQETKATLSVTHREFFNAKLKVLGRNQPE